MKLAGALQPTLTCAREGRVEKRPSTSFRLVGKNRNHDRIVEGNVEFAGRWIERHAVRPNYRGGERAWEIARAPRRRNTHDGGHHTRGRDLPDGVVAPSATKTLPDPSTATP